MATTLLNIHLKNALEVVCISQGTGYSGYSDRLEELVIGAGSRKALELVF